MRTLLHVVLEADEDKGTDYTASGPTEEDNITEADEKEDTLKATDYGEDAPKDEDKTPDDTEDDTKDDSTDEATDYGSEAPTDDTSGDDEEPSPSEDTGATTDEEVQDTKKNSVLIEDFISLYYMIGKFNDKIGSIDKSNADVNRITHQVMANFLVLRKKIFRYIRYDFSSTNYIGNLYAYNSFIEASKLNAAILSESKMFNKPEKSDIKSKASKKR